jgi:hypothetical protein
LNDEKDKTMKLQIITLTAIFISAAPVLGSEICVSRKENNGVINIREVHIIANNKQLFSVVGGEEKCADVTPGKYVIRAQSSNPFEPSYKNQKTWKSERLNILIPAKKKITIAVEPISRGAEYVGPWLLKEIPFNKADTPDPKAVR